MKRFLVPVLFAASVVVLAGCSSRTAPPPARLWISPGKTANLSAEEQQVEDLLKKVAAMPAAVKYFQGFFKTAYVTLGDFDDLNFSIEIRDGAATVKRGVDAGRIPDLVIPLTRRNCENVAEIFADGAVSEEEEYRIFCATFVPSYRSFVALGAMGDDRVLAYLGVPDVLHVILRNEKGYRYANSAAGVAATVAKAGNQWIVCDGLQGTPGRRMEVTVAQAKQFTGMVRDGMAAEGKGNQKLVLEQIRKFLDSVTVPVP